MFFSFGRGGGNAPTQRSFFGSNRGPPAPAPNAPNPNSNVDNNEDDDSNEPDDNTEAQDTVVNVATDRQTASNRRQDVLRVFLMITLVLFFFGGDNPPPADGKHHNNNEDSKHRIVLNPPILGAMQSVFASEAPVALHPVNVTGLYRGQWRGLAPNPFISRLSPAASAAKSNESASIK